MSDAAKGKKRNYIRRKKYLKDCMTEIKVTLDFIRAFRREKPSPSDAKLAKTHAEEIEAVCWSPHSGLSSEDYQKLMSAKTRELCVTILKKALPSLDWSQLQKQLSNMIYFPDRPRTPQPTIPAPICPPPQVTTPQPQGFDTTFEFSALQPAAPPVLEMGGEDAAFTAQPPFMTMETEFPLERGFESLETFENENLGIAEASPFLL